MYRRFTLTTDPNINKQKLHQERKEQKDEARLRKQSRRLRRQFEQMKVGDSVTGTVAEVTPLGILVNIDDIPGSGSAKQPFRIRGLIPLKELPKRFELTSGQQAAVGVELLRQDFVQGRSLTCSVLGISPLLDPNSEYQVKLLLDRMGPMPDESVLRALAGGEEEGSLQAEEDYEDDYADDSSEGRDIELDGGAHSDLAGSSGAVNDADARRRAAERQPSTSGILNPDVRRLVEDPAFIIRLKAEYASLCGKGDSLPVSSLYQWRYLKETKKTKSQQGFVSAADIDNCLTLAFSVSSGDRDKLDRKLDSVNLEQFLVFAAGLETLVASKKADALRKLGKESSFVATGDSGERGTPEVKEQPQTQSGGGELLAALYELLCDGSDVLTVDRLKSWDLLQEIVSAEVITWDGINRLFDDLSLSAAATVTQPQFERFVSSLEAKCGIRMNDIFSTDDSDEFNDSDDYSDEEDDDEVDDEDNEYDGDSGEEEDLDEDDAFEDEEDERNDELLTKSRKAKVSKEGKLISANKSKAASKPKTTKTSSSSTKLPKTASKTNSKSTKNSKRNS
jgi:hypothetical protein